MSVLAAFAVPHPPLIIPGVGKGREQEILATTAAYKEVARRIAALAPETLVISSPHATMYLDYFHISDGAGASGTFARFDDRADGSSVTYDHPFIEALCNEAQTAALSAGTLGERNPELDWGTLVPLHFIQQAYAAQNTRPTYRVVRMGLSGLSPADHYHLGQLVQKVSDKLNRRVVFVASGDLSHKLSETGPYGYAPEGPEFDKKCCEALAQGDYLSLLTFDPGFCERAAECGLRSFQIMTGCLDRTPLTSELLSYEGPFGVGYGIAAFTPTGSAGTAPERNYGEKYLAWHKADMQRRRNEESPWVRLARFTLERFVLTGNSTNPVSNLPQELSEALPQELTNTRAGAFVSIKKNGQLRGCIGTILPTRNTLAEEICANAISAGTRDPRFHAVEKRELDELIYDVDVLSVPEDVSGPEELDPRRYGVIVSTPDGRRGLLLPDLDGVDTVDKQVSIAARKGNIGLYEEGIRYQRFTVTRHM